MEPNEESTSVRFYGSRWLGGRSEEVCQVRQLCTVCEMKCTFLSLKLLCCRFFTILVWWKSDTVTALVLNQTDFIMISDDQSFSADFLSLFSTPRYHFSQITMTLLLLLSLLHLTSSMFKSISSAHLSFPHHHPQCLDSMGVSCPALSLIEPSTTWRHHDGV